MRTAFASKPSFVEARSGRPDAFNFGSASGERLKGGETIKKIFGRIKARKLTHWADPHRRQVNEINTRDGGRGVYFEDPSGNLLEILTRPYGSGA